ncbi:MAG TPA: DUF4286 family protein [Longimicrobiaceae bacterium]|nr:DUF4286 family protein [Longimicrobiaceae bacterium]
MVLYEVTILLDDAARADELMAYMRGRHIPQIYSTGCFRDVRFCRVGQSRFRTVYAANSQEDLDRYLREHSGHLRDDFNTHFADGLTATREVWDVLESWG